MATKKFKEKVEKKSSEKLETSSEKTVIIVESPAKAKTIENILGKEYKVISSKGHVADLPQKDFGVDLKTLDLKFEIIPGKEEHVEFIRNTVKGKKVLLASDPDREGEAIAWHLARLIENDATDKKRITFSAIVPSVIKEAIKNPRDIDLNKVNAQLARRVLDRIVGYKISPLLWRILKDAKSAGRVQSAALKMICDRERERFLFKSVKYYNVWFEKEDFKAFLAKINGTKIKQTDITEEIANSVKEKVKEVELAYIDVKEVKKNPPAPYITSTLQQEASYKLGFSVDKTMKIAQQLYEGLDTPEGHIAFITYMRTDSTRVSPEAQEQTKEFIYSNFGEKYVGESSKAKSKAKTKVQDAHECIRPVDVNITPEKAKNIFEKDHYRLYELIWRRFLASQMVPSIYDQYTYVFEGNIYTFQGSIRERKFDGFELIYNPPKESENEDEEALTQHKNWKKGETFDVEIKTQETQTNPPDRYTEASLVKALESEGIGRPSTYAAIIKTILDRRYVKKERKNLVPTVLGFIVDKYLSERFPEIVNKNFTANMEKELDEVENSKKDWKELIREFNTEFFKDLEKAQKQLFTIDIKTNMKCSKCSDGTLYLKVGKFGLYLKCNSCGVSETILGKPNAVLVDDELYFVTEEEKSEKTDQNEELVEEKKTYGKKSATSSTKKKSTISSKSVKTQKTTIKKTTKSSKSSKKGK